MRKIFRKIESWLWIIALIAALIYFHWLLGNFHVENENLKETQSDFKQELEEKYQKNKQLQNEIQAQLNKITENLFEFLRLEKSSDSFEKTKFDSKSR